MAKRQLILLFSILLSCSFLAGCWDYVSLDDLAIVAGIAIDIDEEDPTRFQVSFEIINTSAAMVQESQGSLLVQSQGKTIYEAIHNANKQLYDQLYFGNMELIVISEPVAKEVGLKAVVDGFLRDPQIRDTVIMVVARGETAKKIITPQKEGGMIISHELNKNLDQERLTTDTTKALQIYEINNALLQDTSAIALPAFSYDEGEEDEEKNPQPVEDGMAIFHPDAQRGYLEEALVPYYLFCVEPLYGGAFSFPLAEYGNKHATLSIDKSVPRLSYRLKDGALTVRIHLAVEASMIEFGVVGANISYSAMAYYEREAATALQERVADMVTLVQTQEKGDIFGIARHIYRDNPKVWEALKADWEALFQDATIEITTEFTIEDTGFLREG
ncbi:Ger(x)C family spore germination protein [Eubacteriales bacterium OttesenSCG-928-M02]|nr:Ger(x)C family spore germination protein [Eubacteriales bacterium OttesenSCG-928-M02]